MQETKTYIGYWWLPNDFENKFQGTLIFETNGDVVLNFLKDSTSIEFNKKFRTRIEIPVLFGLAKDESTNKEFSFKLLDSYVSYSSISRLSYLKIKTNSILKSTRSEFGEDVRFNILRLKPENIDEWFNISGYNLDIEDDDTFSYKLTYKQPNEIELYKSSEFEIKVFFSASYGALIRSEFNSEQSVNINVHFNESKSHDELQEFSRKLRNFFTLAIGHPINILKTEYTVVIKDEKFPNYNFKYYNKSKYKSTSKKLVNSNNMLFDFEMVKDSLQIVFNNWFEKYDELKFLMNNYFGSLYNEYKYVEDRFTDFVFSIEVYHRAKYGGFDLKEKSYLEIRERVLGCVENNSDKQWLEAKLKKYTENKLESRLKNILELNEVSLSGLIENNELFLKQVVETRHYHVHSNVKDEEFVVKDVIELSRINKKLEIIIQAILMTELGFEQDVINKRLKTNSPFDFN